MAEVAGGTLLAAVGRNQKPGMLVNTGSHPTVNRTAPTTKNDPIQSVSLAEVEKLFKAQHRKRAGSDKFSPPSSCHPTPAPLLDSAFHQVRTGDLLSLHFPFKCRR